MNPILTSMTETWTKQESVHKDIIDKVSSEVGFAFPSDYLDFMLNSNGGEGPIGPSNYLSLWKMEDIAKLNKDYDVGLYAPGYLIFGSDGSGTAYAFDKEKGDIVSFQFIGMTMEDNAQFLGNSFVSFLQALGLPA